MLSSNQYYQQPQSQPQRTIIKKGWLFKRGSSCLSRWKLKWAVLYATSSAGHGQQQCQLYIYDTRTGTNDVGAEGAGGLNESVPPKYVIKPPSSMTGKIIIQPIDLDKLAQTARGTSSDEAVKKDWGDMLAKTGDKILSGLFGKPVLMKQAAFVIVTQGKKFYFAAQSMKEMKEWIDVLRYSFRPRQVPGSFHQQLAAIGASPQHQYQQNIDEDGEMYDGYDDDDAESVYSHYTIKSMRRSRSGSSIGDGLKRNQSRSSINTTTTSDIRPQHKVSKQDLQSTLATILSSASSGTIQPVMYDGMTVVSAQEMQSILQSAGAVCDAPMQHRPSVSLDSMTNWDETYQNLFSALLNSTLGSGVTPRDITHTNLRLAEAIGNFRELAMFFGRRIIDKYHIKHHDPIRGAPGAEQQQRLPETFVYADILFNMAARYEDDAASLGSRPGTSLFSNSRFNTVSGRSLSSAGADEEDCVVVWETVRAEKKASNELLAIKTLNRVQTMGVLEGSARTHQGILHTALMCVIRYKGFCMVAYPTMPLEERKTLVLALDAGIAPVRPHEDLIHQNLNAIAQQMNLKSHTHRGTSTGVPVEISYSSRVQAHCTKQSNKVYVLNLSMMMPIDAYWWTRNGGKDFSPRLRPEFVMVYKQALSSDAFRHLTGAVIPTSSSGKVALDQLTLTQDDKDVLDAAKFLLESTLPKFIQKLDQMEILPIDSRGFTTELHKHGLNVRYIGKIYLQTRLPSIRQVCLVEMLARSIKLICRQRLRQAVLHYRNVEASHVEEELKSVVVALFQSVLSTGVKGLKVLWEVDGLKSIIKRKFDIDLDFTHVCDVQRSALFLSLQYHCGVRFAGSIDYDFSCPYAIAAEDFIEFVPKISHPEVSLAPSIIASLSETSKAAFALARHLSLQGPSSKYDPSHVVTSMKLNHLAKQLLMERQFEQARLYSAVALCLAPADNAVSALIRMTMVEAHMGSVKSKQEAIAFIQSEYAKMASVLEYHWGPDHPIHMSLLDRMVYWLTKLSQSGLAYEYLQKSMKLAFRTLGRAHVVSAGYMTKAGYMLLERGRSTDALSMFKEALNFFNETRPESEAVAENHYCIAECLVDLGDIQQALEHSAKSKQIREKLYGQMAQQSRASSHPKIIDSYQQYAKILASRYTDYEGVMTSHMKRDLMAAIQCYEKVFKYMKVQRQDGMKQVGSVDKQAMLLTLTRTLVELKLRMIPSQHKELLRRLREQKSAVPEDAVKEVILKLVHLTPSVYLEELYQRLADSDQSAMLELGTVLQVVEQPHLAVV